MTATQELVVPRSIPIISLPRGFVLHKILRKVSLVKGPTNIALYHVKDSASSGTNIIYDDKLCT